MSSNAALITTSVLFIIVLATMVGLIVYSFSIKNKLKKCPPNCNDGNCSILPTGIYQISAGNVSLLQANDGDLGYVYVGSVSDNVPNGVTLTPNWNVLCLPSPTPGQSVIALFNELPNQGGLNALQQSSVNNTTNGAKMTSVGTIDQTFAQWFNVIPQQNGGYQLMTAGTYLTLNQNPVNSGNNFSTSEPASPDALFLPASNITTPFAATFQFTLVS